MAFEPSEGLYAGLSFVSTADLNAAVNDEGKFKELYFTALSNLRGNKVLDAAGNATKNGMIKVIDFESSSKSESDIYSDLAASISAVLGTRSELRSGDKIPSKVYLTGNRWHKDVEKFKLKAFGMDDYNSSDVILKLNGNDYVGISLKKKTKPKADSPTLINNAFSKFIEGPQLQDVRNKLNDYRIEFFAGVIKEACLPGGPLSTLAVPTNGKSISQMNPSNRQDAKKLWDVKVIRQKSGGKTEKISLINLKSVNDLADNAAVIKKSGSTPAQNSFRDFVNAKLQSTGGKLNPLYSGFLEVMNQPSVKNKLADALLNRVLKLSLLDELDTWADNEFGFMLVEGVGTVDRNNKPQVSRANVVDIHSVMIAIARLAKEDARMELNSTKTFQRSAAKVYFNLYKGDLPILEIELRYKGSFTAFPQFFASMTTEFKDLLKKGMIGI